MLEIDIGVTVIMLIRQLQQMIRSVVVFQKVDTAYRLKMLIVGIFTNFMNIPIMLSWIYFSPKAVNYLNIYLPVVLGLMFLALTYQSSMVIH